MSFFKRIAFSNCWAFILVLMAVDVDRVHAQLIQNVRPFGYFQNYLRFSHDYRGSEESNLISFSLQQINLLFRKDFNQSYSAFINIEAINSFSTESGLGEIKLDEAWLRFHPKKEFSLKIGLHVPQFNNLNTIKNRTPLLPYIFRPLAYESAFSQVVSQGPFFDIPSNWVIRNPGFEFTPLHAYLSVNGKLRAESMRFDYSFYVGNQEDFIAKENVPPTSIVSGTDTTQSVLVGGRIGVRWLSATVGISATHDKSLSATGIPHIKRNRLGIDVSFQVNRYYIEAEYIGVFKNPSDAQKLAIRERLPAFFILTDNLSKHFHYVMLKYAIHESWDVYGYYNAYSDNENIFTEDPFYLWSLGAVHRPFENVSIKAQFLHLQFQPSILATPFGGRALLLGLSVLF